MVIHAYHLLVLSACLWAFSMVLKALILHKAEAFLHEGQKILFYKKGL